VEEKEDGMRVALVQTGFLYRVSIVNDGTLEECRGRGRRVIVGRVRMSRV
jgi:hypothetical protein